MVYVFLVIALVIVVLVFGLLFISFVVSKKPITSAEDEITKFGKDGEILVAHFLKEITDEYGGYLYNDFCFENNEGYSSEIDHILITRGGVFVIETKTIRGTIYGDKNEEKWLCAKKDCMNDKEFRNPIKQNQVHINNLRKLFRKNPPKMISIIIFSLPDSDISNIEADNVYNLKEAIEYINELTIEAHYSREYVERVNDEINYIEDIYSISKEEHVRNIKKLYDN